eukprot:m51a1_g1920 hypothetical protein (510) ;mRNA; f:852900-855112
MAQQRSRQEASQEAERGCVPPLSSGAVLRAAVARARRRQQPYEGSAEQAAGGPFVLQLLRQSPHAQPYALSDGRHYWWCSGLFGESLPHGAVVECDKVLELYPALRLLHGPVGVVGCPACAERCPEVAALAEPSGGSEGQELAIESEGGESRVPADVQRLLRTCVDWSTVHHAYGTADGTPSDLCMLLSEDYATRQRGFEQLYMSVLHQGSIYTATVPAAKVMAELLRLPEATVDWRTRGDIMDFFTSALSSAKSCLASGRFQGRTFEWEDLSSQVPEEDWRIAKGILDAIADVSPVLVLSFTCAEWQTLQKATQLLNAFALNGLLGITEGVAAKEQLCTQWLGNKELAGIVAAGHLCELMKENVPDEALVRLGASLGIQDKPTRRLLKNYCLFSEPDDSPSFSELVLCKWLSCCPIKAMRMGLVIPELSKMSPSGSLRVVPSFLARLLPEITQDPSVKYEWGSLSTEAQQFLKEVSITESAWVFGNMSILMRDMHLPDSQEDLIKFVQ